MLSLEELEAVAELYGTKRFDQTHVYRVLLDHHFPSHLNDGTSVVRKAFQKVGEHQAPLRLASKAVAQADRPP